MHIPLVRQQFPCRLFLIPRISESLQKFSADPACPTPQFQKYYQILYKTLQKYLLGPVIEEVTYKPQKLRTSTQ
jgi:hypothetical protein